MQPLDGVLSVGVGYLRAKAFQFLRLPDLTAHPAKSVNGLAACAEAAKEELAGATCRSFYAVSGVVSRAVGVAVVGKSNRDFPMLNAFAAYGYVARSGLRQVRIDHAPEFLGELGNAVCGGGCGGHFPGLLVVGGADPASAGGNCHGNLEFNLPDLLDQTENTQPLDKDDCLQPIWAGMPCP